MTIVAYILVRVEPGMDQEILDNLRKSNKVVEAVATYGTYDLLVKVSVDSLSDLDNFIFENLRKLPNVKRTATIIARGY